jgi:hypothetical protein
VPFAISAAPSPNRPPREAEGAGWEKGPHILVKTAFYQVPELERRWRHYLAAGAVLVPPPAQFEVIGERISRFLGPVRDSILEGSSFSSTWTPGGPWR